MSEYNSQLMDDEKQFTASTWRGILVMAIWFTGVTLLTVFLKVVPFLATWTPLGLVIVGSSAAWLRSINRGQDTREQALAQYRASKLEETRKQRQEETARKDEARKERREARKARQAKIEKVASIKQAVQASLQGSSKPKTAHTIGSPIDIKQRSSRKSTVSDEELMVEYKLDPTITSDTLAARFNVSRQAIGQRRDKLAKSGKLDIVKNENGRIVRVDVLLDGASTMGQGS